MRRIAVFETYDGKHHGSRDDALRYLDKIFGGQLTSIAHRICAADGKYAKVCEVLEASLGDMAELLRVKEDMVQLTDELGSDLS